MKKLSQLLHKIEHDILFGAEEDIEIANLVIDSRKVTEGSLFVCIKGTKVDGHQYIQAALDKGAKAILVSEEVEFPAAANTVIIVNDTRIALDSIAEQFYDEPAKSMRMIGVTGTNGKTSTTYFMEQILIEHQRCVGVIGTIEQRVNQHSLNVKITTSTTPDTIELQHILSMMKAEKADDVVMEVTSHALALNKVCGIDFEVAIFTNLTQDHLDFHGSMENYIREKAKLFRMCKHAVINADSDVADYLLQTTTGKTLTYSIEKPSDLQAKNIVYTDKGTKFTLDIENKSYPFYISIAGQFSLYNALAVVGAALALQIPIDVIQRALQNMKDVPGRIEKIKSDQPFNVFVDYAHTPDGLKNILQAVRAFTKERVIVIFGCGGDRDKTKRPIMGAVCAELADHLIVTSDNPRSEDPQAIIDDVLVGIGEGVSCEHFTDRKTAIFRGIDMAQEGDSIVIAGKGHEDYQEFKNETIHFDDREVARLALSEREA